MGDSSLFKAVEKIPGKSFHKKVVRCLPKLDFDKGNPPQYLFVSGNVNRLNPQGISCLYFAELEETAIVEYGEYWKGTKAEHQPKLTFFAEVKLACVLDMENPETIKSLGIQEDVFYEGWRLAEKETRLQEIGRCIANQNRIQAIRYPSNAVKKLGRVGWNIAIFPEALQAPNFVHVLSKTDEPLEKWPLLRGE